MCRSHVVTLVTYTLLLLIVPGKAGACDNDPNEPNETLDDASQLPPTGVQGTLCANDIDHFSVLVSAGCQPELTVILDAGVLIEVINLDDEVTQTLNAGAQPLIANSEGDFLTIRISGPADSDYDLAFNQACAPPACSPESNDAGDTSGDAHPVAVLVGDFVLRSESLCQGAAAEADWFEVAVPSGCGSVLIESLSDVGSDMDLKLYDAQMALLATSDEAGTFDDVEVTGTAPVFLEVTPKSSEPTESHYLLLLEAEGCSCLPDGFEPDDSEFAAATLPTTGLPVSATLCVGDIDHRRYLVPAGCQLSVDVQSSGGSLTVTATGVDGPKSNELAVPAGAEASAVWGSNVDEVVVLEILNGTAGGNGFSYTIAAELECVPPASTPQCAGGNDDPYEPNDSAIEPHGWAGGHLIGVACVGDSDWFEILAPPGVCELAVVGFSSETMVLTAYDAVGMTLGPVGTGTPIHLAVDEGPWALKVEQSGSEAAPYGLVTIPSDPQEPNGTDLSARYMEVGDPVAGLLCVGDTDVLAFTAPAGCTASIDLTFDLADPPVATLRRRNGVTVGTVTPTSTGATLTAGPVHGGAYYLTLTPGSTGALTYQAVLDLGACPTACGTDLGEPNDDPTSGSPIALEQDLARATCAGDPDYLSGSVAPDDVGCLLHAKLRYDHFSDGPLNVSLSQGTSSASYVASAEHPHIWLDVQTSDDFTLGVSANSGAPGVQYAAWTWTECADDLTCPEDDAFAPNHTIDSAVALRSPSVLAIACENTRDFFALPVVAGCTFAVAAEVVSGSDPIEVAFVSEDGTELVAASSGMIASTSLFTCDESPVFARFSSAGSVYRADFTVTCVPSGPPGPCDDDNDCTSDDCTPEGGCTNDDSPTEGLPCDDGVACTSQDFCFSGLCVGANSTAPCDNGDVCTLAVCSDGTCITSGPLDCDDANSCTLDSCDSSAGCQHTFDDGAACTDGNACTSGDTCGNGICGGAPLICTDGDECTNNSCDPATGCTFPPIDCADDGDPCTIDVCAAGGGCHQPMDCDDGDSCTINDACAGGQCVSDFACDDGKACTNDSCSNGVCTNVNTCTDGQACSNDICDAVLGCVFPAPGCEDNNECTFNTCVGEVCTYPATNDMKPCADSCNTVSECQDTQCVRADGGVEVDCNDGFPCTTDSCDPQLGCQHENLCDGTPCSTGECTPWGCLPKPSADNPCDDGDDCTQDLCDLPGAGTCTNDATAMDGFACDDGVPCNGEQLCTGGVCPPGGVPDCGGNGACTTAVCGPDGCEYTDLADGDDCGDDPCFLAKTCQQGLCEGAMENYRCADSTPCKAPGCDGVTGCFTDDLPDGFPCNDDNPCTGEYNTCLAGQCSNTPPDCDDNNECTTDSCEPGVGCVSSDVADNTACGTDEPCWVSRACQTGDCVGGASPCEDDDNCTVDACEPGAPGSPVECSNTPNTCEDGDECTEDECNAAGCTNPPVPGGTPCSDGPCFANQTCNAGECGGGIPACDDGSLCTVDQCDSSDGSCSHSAVQCADDGDECTEEYCDPIGGCQIAWTIAGTPCNDGAPCQINQTCLDGECQAGEPACVPLDNCTVATCDPADGTCNTETVGCDDDNDCTVDSCDPAVGCVGDNALSGTLCSDNCHESGQCNGNGECEGGDLCDDGSVCTTDYCAPETGVCSTALITCDDGEPCTANNCSALDGCEFPILLDQSPCDDGDACWTQKWCQAGDCSGGLSDCDDGQPCTLDTCDPTTGDCAYSPVTCDDSLACTDDQCAADASCLHTPVHARCADGDASTLDLCDPIAGGCQSEPVGAPGPCVSVSCNGAACVLVPDADGTACDSGLAGCNSTMECLAGECASDCADDLLPEWPTATLFWADHVGRTSAKLRWTPATDNVGVAQYVIAVDGEERTTVLGTAHSTQIAGLEPNTVYVLSLRAEDSAGNSTDTVGSSPTLTITTRDSLPPAPRVVLEPPELGVPYRIEDVAAGLRSPHAGYPDPIQEGAQPGSISVERVAVLRGRIVEGATGAPRPGVTVAVLGQPQYGSTVSRLDGFYDLAVNGGATVTLDFRRAGYLRAQRSVETRWRDFAVVDDVALVTRTPAYHPTEGEGTDSVLIGSTTRDFAISAPVTDKHGTRSVTVWFPPGTTVSQKRNGETIAIPLEFDVAVTEATIALDCPDGMLCGAAGLAPRRMPGSLPAASALTWAADISLVDSSGEPLPGETDFDGSVVVYVDDFMGFLASQGGPSDTAIKVPVGVYDLAAGRWKAEASGQIIRMVGIITSAVGDPPKADVESPELVLSDEEAEALARRYSGLVASDFPVDLWRAELGHFSTWDLNWGSAPPDDAEPPPSPAPAPDDLGNSEGGGPGGGGPGNEDSSEPERNRANPNQTTADNVPLCKKRGSIIGVETGTLGESVGLIGTNFGLAYSSDTTPGFAANRRIDIPLSEVLPVSAVAIYLEVAVAGRKLQWSWKPEETCSGPGCEQAAFADYQRFEFLWDGLDAYGRRAEGAQAYRVRTGFGYLPQYQETERFGEYSYGNTLTSAPGSDGAQDRQELVLWSTTDGEFPALLDARGLGLGGWTPSVLHRFDPASSIVYHGNGARRGRPTSIAHTTPTLTPSGGVLPRELTDLAIAPDGTKYIVDAANDEILVIGPTGAVESQIPIPPDITNIQHIIAEAAGSLVVSEVVSGNAGKLHRLERGSDSAWIWDHIAGNGAPCADNTYDCPGDDPDSSTVNMNRINAMAPGPHADVYFAGDRVLGKVLADGSYVRLSGVNGPNNDSSALSACSAGQLIADCQPGSAPVGLHVSESGALFYLADNKGLYHVNVAGIVEPMTGSLGQTPWFLPNGDGGPVELAYFEDPQTFLSAGADGSLFIGTEGAANETPPWVEDGSRVRRVRPDGIIETVLGCPGPAAAGKCTSETCLATDTDCWLAEERPALDFAHRFVSDVEVAPDGQVWVLRSEDPPMLSKLGGPSYMIESDCNPSCVGTNACGNDGCGGLCGQCWCLLWYQRTMR
ncbi:MAG: hypothetical protein ACI9OJ_000244 [Myxococcota bacterium]|jgi:hypothetical protein